jgi:hypothetical protein
MKNEIITEDQMQELFHCAAEEGSEWGESISPLCSIYHSAKYLSSEFYEAYKKELKFNYDLMIENTKVVTKKEKIVYKEVKYRVWK